MQRPATREQPLRAFELTTNSACDILAYMEERVLNAGETLHKPIVGVPCYTPAKTLAGMPPSFVLPQAYIRRLEAAGAAPVMIPPLDDTAALRTVYERLDGLLLAGGGDVDPAWYGEAPHPKLGHVDSLRDRVEVQLIRWALQDDLPILAICRGIQVLNVAAGGTLYQDITAQCPGAMSHSPDRTQSRDDRTHAIEIEPNSLLRSLLGTPRLVVNSGHHQAVKDTAPGFRVTARAEDGIIEGIEGLGRSFCVGVQWHPESLAHRDPTMQRLFEGFVAAAQKAATGFRPVPPGR